ncbi:hypothetical protein V2H45_00265 [Tumidithrix elongata RA019]|uniref:Glycosyltransferase n=1 Tax=Tumidithrix elongata BACA0141 TaxID=2716417 RepID=A0AAW9PXE7_9CYAN|nr:hypothetical protein [Tumidithrix elongata RA019]
MNKSIDSEITVVIFSCEGREHLLPATIASFDNALKYQFHRRILALDGSYRHQDFDFVKPDLIVHSYIRRGYVQSIINALALVDTEFFFWLEDDWQFTQPIELEHLLNLLQKNLDWLQIRFSKTAPLTQEEKRNPVTPEIFESIYGFSANPCICRTKLVRLGFEALQQLPKDKFTGFETFLSNWCISQKKICAVFDPKDSATVIHTGYLEGTPRQWHMTASLAGKADKYLSSMGHTLAPSILQKISMLYKLIKVLLSLSIHQFWNRAAYDLSFRIVSVTKQFKKS